jgi:DNA-binding response OmpR family regulator
MKSNILLVEDETDLANVVKQYLEVMDFSVMWCKNGREALEHFKDNSQVYDILLLDVSLPGMDGFDLAIEVLKYNEDVPFLFLTARSEKQDKIHGLKIGADDYIVKPFDIDELVLRIRNILKRRQGFAQVHTGNNIEFGDVKFLKDALKLQFESGKESMLTPREAELLQHLLLHQNQVVKREDILVQLWGSNDYFLGRSLDVFISRLRKHFSNSTKVSINNIYGVGFIFSVK